MEGLPDEFGWTGIGREAFRDNKLTAGCNNSVLREKIWLKEGEFIIW